ncbi:MAG: tetratricopeptide repeat protein [Pirellulales bacterium]
MSDNQMVPVKSWRRSLSFRVGAIAIGLLPLLFLELVLWGWGWQNSDAVTDPYIGFTEIRPLFEVNSAGAEYEIASNRMPLFCEAKFPAAKANNEFRIFCIGGSTVQGRPFAPDTSFSKWLQLRLEKLDSNKKWTVVNCGGVSYASYRLVPIVDEILDYGPDLIILYTGQNEFLEDRTYGLIKETPNWIGRTHDRLSSIRSYAFLRASWMEAKAGTGEPENVLPTDVEARLDFRDGLEKHVRDDIWRGNVVDHFEQNLNAMVRAIQAADVPLILCNPVTNLRDASPFKSQHSSSMTDSQVSRFESEWEALIEATEARVEWVEMRDRLKALVAMNPRHAEAHYRLGQVYQQLGQLESAREHLVLAKEEDVCPLRIVEPMYRAINRVAKGSAVPVVDVKSFFESVAPDGIPGRESLLDHVHPTIFGHQQISELLLLEMIEQGLVEVKAGLPDCGEVFENHLESLPFIYFELGKDRLAGLKRWAEGKVTREREPQ